MLGAMALTATPGFGQSAGPNNAGTGQNVTGVGTIAWTNPGNIVSDNNVYATAVLPTTGSISNYLRGTNYGFAIPSNATILGITVTIGKYSSNFIGFTAVNDNAVNLVKAGAVTGTNKAQGTWPTSETATAYGGAADLWGTTWTPADINASTFGVVISAQNNSILGISYTAYVDYIQVTVTYQGCIDPTLPTLAVTSSPICPGTTTTLQVTGGTLNNATAWHWYSGSCGGSPVGTGVSVNVSPTVTTTYYARGEGGCVIPGSCSSITVNVHPQQAATDHFRSKGSGNWSSASTWQRSADNIAWCDATAAPDDAAAEIVIGSGHIVTVDVNSSGSDVLVTGTLNGGSALLNVTGDFTGTGTFSAGTGTIYMDGTGPQQLGGFTYYNLSNNNAFAAVTATGPVTVNGLLDNGGNSNVAAILDMQGYPLTLNGARGNNGATIRFSGTANGIGGWGSGTIEYYGTASGQVVAAGTYGSLTINNSNGVTLGGNVTVNGYKHFESTLFGALDLLAGMVHTAGYTLSVGPDQAINGADASKYIDGILERGIKAGANNYDFPIGTAIAYAPVYLSFAAGTTAGALKGYTTEGDHPDLINSSFDPLYTVNRTWSFTIVSGMATALYDATFHWASADMDASFDYMTAIAGKYTAGTWEYPATGALFSTNAQVTGLSGFSDFQIGNGCLTPPTATISGNALICSGDEVVLRVDLTGTPGWSYTWSDGTTTGTVTGVATSPSYLTFNPTQTTTYTIVSVTDSHLCTAPGIGSAKADIGPVTIAPQLAGCTGEAVAVPITVKNFHDIGAMSFTLKYDNLVLEYDSSHNSSGLIQNFFADETNGVLRFSGYSGTTFPPLADNDTLLTLFFTHQGGTCDLAWDDTDDIWCEYAAGPPEFQPYCDNPTAIYYVNGKVTGSDIEPDFEADELFPPKNSDVQLSDLSTGAVSWAWSFDRPGVTFVNGTGPNDKDPVVQFTDGGLYSVTLTVSNGTCSAELTKTGYIRAGTSGIWTGATSTDWYTVTNWDDHLLPTAVIDVLIPTVVSGNYPLLAGALPDLTTSVHCKNITVSGTATLTVKGLLTISPGTALIIEPTAVVTAGE